MSFIIVISNLSTKQRLITMNILIILCNISVLRFQLNTIETGYSFWPWIIDLVGISSWILNLTRKKKMKIKNLIWTQVLYTSYFCFKTSVIVGVKHSFILRKQVNLGPCKYHSVLSSFLIRFVVVQHGFVIPHMSIIFLFSFFSATKTFVF